jgi:hypothetical protein
MSAESQIKVLQEENQQLKIALAAKMAELEQFQVMAGTQHVNLTRMVLDGLYHIFKGAQTPGPNQQAVRAEIERVWVEIENYLKVRNRIVIAGSGKTQ